MDSNINLSNHLNKLSEYYLLEKDDYRAKVFGEIANKIKDYPEPIISGEDAKKKIGRGVGPSTIKEINEFLSTGTSTRLQSLENKYSSREKVMQLFMSLHGVGPISANKFYEQGFRTLEDLWNKADLTNAQKLSIIYYNQLSLRIPRKELDLVKESFEVMFPRLDFVIVGSYRRGESTSGDIDILIKKSNSINLNDIVIILKNYGTISGDLAQGESKYLGLFHLPNGNARRLDLLIIEPEYWGTALLYFTGSQRFNILMRQRAIDLGYRLNEYGLYKEDVIIPTTTEEDIFDILRVKFLTPEERTREINNLEFI